MIWPEQGLDPQVINMTIENNSNDSLCHGSKQYTS